MSVAAFLCAASLPQPPSLPSAIPPPSPEVFILMAIVLMAASGLFMWMCGYESGRRAGGNHPPKRRPHRLHDLHGDSCSF